MRTSLRIAVTGLAGSYPFGGVFWDYLQYPLGLQRLGHEVLYIEDTGQWCYDPEAGTFTAEGEGNAAFLARHIRHLEPALANCWFFRDAAGKTYGQPWGAVVDFCRSADALLNVSGNCWMRDEYRAAARLVYIDSDPMYTQADVPDYLAGSLDDATRKRTNTMRQYDVFFTFGENIGAPDCKVPTGVFNWIPTRQPVVLDLFEGATVPRSSRRHTLTTVGSWEPSEKNLVVAGVVYKGKSAELERFLDLPARSVLPLELAMGGRAPVERLRARGWQMVDAYGVSKDPWVYRDYLANSLGEWSVAKNAYVASRCGWFSCRTACYLALGVPAVVQDTGFAHIIPTGEGVLSFATPAEAADAIGRLAADPDRHAKAASAIAREYFASDKVLGRLLDKALTSQDRPAPLPAFASAAKQN
jgi:hypothetical protein